MRTGRGAARCLVGVQDLGVGCDGSLCLEVGKVRTLMSLVLSSTWSQQGMWTDAAKVFLQHLCLSRQTVVCRN